MNEYFKKYELISLVIFLISCTAVFSGLLMLFRGLYLIGGVAIIVFTIKAMAILNKSKVKKVLLVIAQLVGYVILYILWLIIYLMFFWTGGFGPGPH